MNENTKNIQEFSSEINKAASKSNADFLAWFNDNENKNSVIISGYRDLHYSIIKEKIYRKIKTNSRSLIACEIGCGGGRIMNATAKIFKNVIGLDIHKNLDDTDKFLLEMGNNNTKTHEIIDCKFPLKDDSVDFIYSFIVFQHLLKIETFIDYSREIAKKLKTTGVAIIYFGRPRFFSNFISNYKSLNYLLMILDRILFEYAYINLFRNGYIEYPKVEANDVNLVVSVKKARKIFGNAGLRVTDSGISQKNNAYGTQYYLSLKK